MRIPVLQQFTHCRESLGIEVQTSDRGRKPQSGECHGKREVLGVDGVLRRAKERQSAHAQDKKDARSPYKDPNETIKEQDLTHQLRFKAAESGLPLPHCGLRPAPLLLVCHCYSLSSGVQQSLPHLHGDSCLILVLCHNYVEA